jgi:hypothetical protein
MRCVRNAGWLPGVDFLLALPITGPDGGGMIAVIAERQASGKPVS